MEKKKKKGFFKILGEVAKEMGDNLDHAVKQTDKMDKEIAGKNKKKKKKNE